MCCKHSRVFHGKTLRKKQHLNENSITFVYACRLFPSRNFQQQATTANNISQNFGSLPILKVPVESWRYRKHDSCKSLTESIHVSQELLKWEINKLLKYPTCPSLPPQPLESPNSIFFRLQSLNWICELMITQKCQKTVLHSSFSW